MKGKREVIDVLNEALKLELGAVNQYWLHYRMLENWGFTKLAKKERAESIEEMHHADKLVTRIIFLEGLPNLQHVAPLMIGENLSVPPNIVAQLPRNSARPLRMQGA